MLATVALLLSLGLDTFAVAVGLGLAGVAVQRWRRMALVFALAEGLMPIVGLLLGQRLGDLVGALAAYLAAGVLIVVGLLTVREALGDDDHARTEAELRRPLLVVALSVSLDELAIGVTLGLLDVALGPALVYIALQAFGLTLLGLALGRRAGAELGERAELAAGVVLTLLGVALALSEATGIHLL